MQPAHPISPCSNEAEEPLSAHGSLRFNQRPPLLCFLLTQDQHEPQGRHRRPPQRRKVHAFQRRRMHYQPISLYFVINAVMNLICLALY